MRSSDPDQAGGALIAIERADIGYGRSPVLRAVDLRVESGAFLGIVGPNGVGKTTLLKAVLGQLKPMAGRIAWPRGALRIGYVPQRQGVDSLYPLSVLDIVLMGRYARMGPLARPARDDRDAARNALEHVGIADLAGRGFSGLSGGQKQRTLIARALAGEPELLVLDEPTNGMDLPSEYAILELVRSLHAEGLTVLMVSHLLSTVAHYARRIAIVSDGSVREGATGEMLQPDRLAEVYGLPVRVATVEEWPVILPGGAGPGEAAP